MKTPVELAKERGEPRTRLLLRCPPCAHRKRKQQQQEQVKQLEREQEANQEPQRGSELRSTSARITRGPRTTPDHPDPPGPEAGAEVSRSPAAGEPRRMFLADAAEPGAGAAEPNAG